MDRYKRYLLLEKGLSKNTIESYMRDLQKLVDFSQSRNLKVENASQADLDEFLGEQREKGLKPRSMARVISSLKSFYHFLLLNKLIEVGVEGKFNIRNRPQRGFKPRN